MKKLAFLGLFLSSVVLAVPASVPCHVNSLDENASVGTGAAVLVAAEDQARKCLAVINKGSQIVYITFAAGGGATEGVPLAAGERWDPNYAITNAIYARSSSGTQTVLVVQGK